MQLLLINCYMLTINNLIIDVGSNMAGDISNMLESLFSFIFLIEKYVGISTLTIICSILDP